ncbi:MAG: A/G-specific adenine glycosylase [Magnetospiraceae bacterium]
MTQQRRLELLTWYDHNKRTLPWRTEANVLPDPYAVWLSEIMLQQTTVVTVIPYYTAFLSRWPRVTDLAAAPLDDVLHAWQGMGYYARARNLHRCAITVAKDHGGRFPDQEEGLKELPGIGPYTAAAIAAIAFGRAAVPVDGNVERVMARFHAVTTPLPAAKPALTAFARALTPPPVEVGGRPGDFAQALMELGATICTPRKPACGLCPWRDGCQARRNSIPEDFPFKTPKPPKPVRYGYVYLAVRRDGSILLRRRPEKGLLGGMMEFPSTAWADTLPDLKKAQNDAPVPAVWRPVETPVRHVFTHFALELTVLRGAVQGMPAANGLWTHPRDFGALALPTLMKKVARAIKTG